MRPWQPIVNWLEAHNFMMPRRGRNVRRSELRRVNGVDIPNTGRSSVESTLGDRFGSALNFWGTVSPVIDFESLALLKHLWVYNPDMSQYVANIQNLANPGHQIIVDASTKLRARRAVERINESASRLYRNGAGIDGLINAYLAQIAWSGALSSEDVVDFSRRRVDKVVLVPVEQIRFRYLEGEHVPHQQPGVGAGLARSPLGLIRLNPETYQYYALQTVENCPYAKPPASAALTPITTTQADMMKSIQFIARKFGLFGLTSITVTKPPQGEDETDEAYMSRCRNYLAAVGAAAEKISQTGMIVTYDDQKAEHTDITGDFKGGYELFRTSEEQVFSGLNGFPAFFGRTDSTTETYANVVYNFMAAQGHNVQRLPKRRLERTYRLDTRLAGLEVDGISVVFNKTFSRDPLKDAQAEELRTATAILKAAHGLISPDKAAQELGYDSAYDPTLLARDPEAARKLRALARGGLQEMGQEPFTFRFDKDSHSYKFVPVVIDVSPSVPPATRNGHGNGEVGAAA